MKKLVLLLAFFVAVFISHAQNTALIVKKGEKGLFLEHTVAAREGLYAIGRLYNVSPRFIAAYNKIDLNGGLNVGQVLQIPLTDTNFFQKKTTDVPLYYLIGSGETLSAISRNNKNVSLQSLRSWNKMENDNVRAGEKIIVGFLRSPGMTPATLTALKKPEPENKTAVSTETVKTEIKQEPKKEESKPIVKEEPKKEEAKPVVNDETKKEEIRQAVEAARPAVNNKPASGGTGYFKIFYEQQVKSQPVSKNSTVTSGIFKTTSGWEDGKYYLLIDNVTPGTIVKIINPENDKEIYAKVLGQMSGIRQNEGYDIRISNAAASVLQINDEDKFIVKLNY